MHKRATNTKVSIAEKLMLRAEEVADLLGIGKNDVYQLGATGELGRVKIGNRSLYPRIKVDQYVARLMREQGVEVDA